LGTAGLRRPEVEANVGYATETVIVCCLPFGEFGTEFLVQVAGTITVSR
jgi:hypothetical protein